MTVFDDIKVGVYAQVDTCTGKMLIGKVTALDSDNGTITLEDDTTSGKRRYFVNFSNCAFVSQRIAN